MTERRKNGWIVKYFVTALIAAMLLATVAMAAYPSHKDLVSDAAVILDEGCENGVKAASAKLRENRNASIAVCTVLNTDGVNIGDYARVLFEKWRVGHGVLILVSVETDDFYAVQSNSVSEILTNEKLSEIINSTLGPAITDRDYSGGVTAAVNAVSSFLGTNLPEGFGEAKKGMPVWAIVLIVIAAIIVVVVAGGYALLIFLEKRQARRRREEMEARRRMLMNGMGRDPRGRRPSGAYGNRSPSGASGDRRSAPNGRRPMGNDGRPVRGGNAQGRGQAPRRDGAVPAHGQNGMNSAARRYPENVQRQRSAGDSTQVINRVPGGGSRPVRNDNRQVSSAATIQINTADIKAAMKSRDRK
ncbi:MAG: TPM domain-containing protein [Clostridia bacterium]|nr:TPM domain-containing protein [Clostridia bacterium]